MFVIIARAVLIYIVVIFAIRVMGKRQVGDLQPGELVITILISEVAVMPLEDRNQPILAGIVAIFVLVIMEIFTSVVTMKWFAARKVINGRSAIIINDGQVDKAAMKRLRITVPDLMELLRCQNVFDISTVAYAILETNGQLSVLLKMADQAATRQDVGAKPPKQGYPALVISDGIILQDSAALVGVDEKHIEALLSKKGLTKDRVFLMTLDRYGKHTIVKKEE